MCVMSHSVIPYQGDRSHPVSITMMEVATTNGRMGKGYDKVIPIGREQGGKGYYKSPSIHKVCEWVSVSQTHTYSWLTSDTSAGVAWAECHVWWPAPVAGLALSTPACYDLRLTPCTSIFVDPPSVFISLAKWVCLAYTHKHTHTFQLSMTQRSWKTGNNVPLFVWYNKHERKIGLCNYGVNFGLWQHDRPQAKLLAVGILSNICLLAMSCVVAHARCLPVLAELLTR